jgi:hypothetical protein
LAAFAAHNGGTKTRTEWSMTRPLTWILFIWLAIALATFVAAIGS